MKHAWLDNANCSVLFSVPDDAHISTLANIKQFHAKSELKKATVSYIVSQLVTKEEKESIAKVFRSYDRNGDGFLSKEEIRQSFDRHHLEVLHDEDFDEIFKQVDIDQSGMVDYSGRLFRKVAVFSTALLTMKFSPVLQNSLLLR